MSLQEGSPAPAIELLSDSGAPFSLASVRGKNVVLFFYPKADTPGCTTEVCEFRDAFPSFTGVDAVILGISPDTVKAQAKFKQKFLLPYTLLCDTEHAVAEAYGVWAEKSMYGRTYMGIERTTFLIGADGVVKRIFRKVKPKGHAAEIVAALGS